MAIGAPSTYTEEIGEAICRAVAASPHGLRKTLEKNGLPPFDTVQEWLAGRGASLAFSQNYAQAKRQQIEAMAEDIVDISQDETLDANERRLMVDTRKWLLSKLIPKTYGDKLDVTSAGEKLVHNAISIDQRVQSILMQATARRRGEADSLQLDANALKLLD